MARVRFRKAIADMRTIGDVALANYVETSAFPDSIPAGEMPAAFSASLNGKWPQPPCSGWNYGWYRSGAPSTVNPGYGVILRNRRNQIVFHHFVERSAIIQGRDIMSVDDKILRCSEVLPGG